MTAVLVTTTYTPAINDPRFLQALQTCEEAWCHGYPMVVVDGSPDLIAEDVRILLQDRGANVFRQRERGMGASRRECLQHGLATDAEVLIWLEPEKYSIVFLLELAIAMVETGNYDVVVPRRRNLDGYPAYQQLSELRANWELGDITGKHDLDLMFGPRVFSRRAADLFASYFGATPQQDNWEIIFIPVLWALQLGMKIGSCLVDYSHPPEQTAREEGDTAMDRKRDEQRVNLITAMREEAGRLK